MPRNKSGMLVETKTGKKGKVFNDYELINSKVPVYVEGEEKPLLCSLDSLKVVGYFD